MAFSLSDSFQYSRLGHPDQPQKCKLFSNPICPLVAEDEHPKPKIKESYFWKA
jgi:hypothetical protein